MPDHQAAIGTPDHPRLTKSQRTQLISDTKERLGSAQDAFLGALGQIELDQLLKVGRTPRLASMLVDFFVMSPLTTWIRGAWAAANVTFTAPHLTAAGSALSANMLQAARGHVKIGGSRTSRTVRQIMDMFDKRYRIYNEYLRESLIELSDAQRVAAFKVYAANNIDKGRIRRRLRSEIATFRDVVQVPGLTDSTFRLMRVHRHTKTKPTGRGQLWLAQDDQPRGYRLERSVPARWHREARASHKQRFGGTEPMETVITDSRSHRKLYPGLVAQTLHRAFKPPRPKRRIGPPTPTRTPDNR